jgi:Holliday junction DNA helicase RuvB
MSTLDSIIGQKAVISRLKALIAFYVPKGKAVDHILLIGPDHAGQRTIVRAFAKDCGVPYQEVKGDLTAAELTNFRERHVFAMFNIHRLTPNLTKLLLSSIQDFRLDIVIGAGPQSVTHTLDIQPFTLIATTPREADCTADFLRCFPVRLAMSPYSPEELRQIAEIIAASMKVPITPQAAQVLAFAANGDVQTLDSFIRRIGRLHEGMERISEQEARTALEVLGIAVLGQDAGAQQSDLNKLSGQQFESFISQLLMRMSFRTEITKASGDGGIDIVAVLDKPLIGGRY